MSNTYSIHETRARMPASCWGASHYVRIAVVEHPSGDEIWSRNRVHDGSTDRCEAAKVRKQAKELIAFRERVQLMAALALQAGMILCNEAQLDGDYLACRKKGSGVIIRYDASWRRTGVAVAMPKDMRSRWNHYEHGINARVCRTEIAAKRVIVEVERRQAAVAERDERRLRLGLVLCHNLRVTYKHARAAGMCDAGIQAYCHAHNLDVDTGATLKDLQSLADGRYIPAATLALRAALIAHRVNKTAKESVHAEAS